ncbi:evolutionarily conserved signaling intermediate in Toll pathway, mitochondrial isoform X2 [Calliopsis andreniformis]|uniref:evolutionarily conserved signaling intermediate in Toll pathway, mitochondrial isoform X2 n=1 Tax=Calliopsis andreniformis TaxID=337506 RepID=UPI003FCE3104
MVKTKEKQAFIDIIRLYIKENRLRTGHVEFIKKALMYMDEFGVNKDIDVYKALLDVFPKGKFIPTNVYQIMLYYYPKQQDAALEVLRKMEENQVIPDFEVQQILLNVFGERGYPLKKLWRMIYWMPKFSKLNPWPVPEPIPKDSKVLAQYALKKLASIDVQSEVTTYETKEVPDAIDDTWIVSSMSKSQSELLALQPTNKPLFIEGPFMVWVADQCIDYFVLKGEPIKRKIIYETFDDVSNLQIPFWEKLHINMPVTIHEQDDGVYYAMCATGTSSKDSLLSWIRCLQKTNPVLENIPIVFKLKSSVPPLPSYIEEGSCTDNTLQTSQNVNVLKDKD